jgi:uncharacterized protein YbcC (UPF0753/DUF2309 family)
MSQATAPKSSDMRQQLRDIVAHMEHFLPGQAPIRDFVHHNTLHGFQHLPFQEAVAEARKLTGAYAYLPPQKFRQLFGQGRITDDDLIPVLAETPQLESAQVVLDASNGPLPLAELYTAALKYPIEPISAAQLTWNIEETEALSRFQPDVPQERRRRILSQYPASADPEGEAIAELWGTCLEMLDLSYYLLHPEELTEITPEQLEQLLQRAHDAESTNAAATSLRWRLGQEATKRLDQLLGEVGKTITLRGLLLALSGHDLLDDIRPSLVRHMASFLDQGGASWHHEDRAQGFYRSWRQSALKNPAWALDELDAWREQVETLPDNAVDAVIEQLNRLGLAQNRWGSYLERLALELPGWSGMFLWRDLHPGYDGHTQPVEMMDYLAVRLILERMFALRLFSHHWQLEPNLEMVRWHFRHNPSELYVRNHLYGGQLPEFLSSRAQRLVDRAIDNPDHENSEGQWHHIASMIWAWRQNPASGGSANYSVQDHGWRLFRLCQHLGLSATDLNYSGAEAVHALLKGLTRLDDETAGFLCLRAYERHYHETIFNALVNNQNRGPWANRNQRPDAQVVFCMDDREEGIRRHLEEINPRIETLGAAGFFGVVINWRGLDDNKVTALCPVVATPAHELREVALPEAREVEKIHRKRRKLRLRLKDLLYNDMRRDLISTTAGSLLSAPAALASLGGKMFVPLLSGRLNRQMREHFEMPVATELQLTAEDGGPSPSPEQNRLGFTDDEQTDRVEGFLRTIGLTYGFAPLVVMMGHGSSSENNPHGAAYDCGACSGKHGGPNARAFAAMANRPEVRERLRQRGIDIPADSLFVGAFHNTCNEDIDWFDLNKVNPEFQPGLERLREQLTLATRHSAHERCRKFFSAPRKPNLTSAIRHIMGRRYDISQARPELGHATNAVAMIGRRSMTRGAFFDRRAFLISYDPSQDPEGKIIEAILLAAGPVGAGINLEYYFSTVNNEEYGCGSKVTHNVTGFLGVMEGASSDLRTGLPRQMIEIHEAMRLLVIVEAKTEILTEIYLRQPPLQELVGNGWLLLAAKDPDSERIDQFKPDRGWVEWQGERSRLPLYPRSGDYYPGTMEPLSPVLIEQEEIPHAQ